MTDPRRRVAGVLTVIEVFHFMTSPWHGICICLSILCVICLFKHHVATTKLFPGPMGTDNASRLSDQEIPHGLVAMLHGEGGGKSGRLVTGGWKGSPMT